MFNIYSTNYLSLSNEVFEDLSMLRKTTFKDRLQWAVTCSDDKEIDQFDNERANYIFGVEQDMVICGTRIIDMKDSNMLDSTFSSFFNNVTIPEGSYIESTRFFVDKKRSRTLLGSHFPVTMVLFLSLINYARLHHYDGIIAVASHSMMQIIKNSGWDVTVLATGMSEKDEPVYLLLGNVDINSQYNIKEKINSRYIMPDERILSDWPLSFEPSIN